MGEVSFRGKVAAVTGAGRGLGREFALLLARRGASVVVNDIGVSADEARYGSAATASPDGRDPARDVAEEINRAGGRAVANVADVSEPGGAQSIVDDALRAFDGLDIVINNAGIVITREFGDLTVDELDKCYAVHVRGPFLVCKAAWPCLAKSGRGRVLNVCSVDGVLFGNMRHTAYDAAKGGLSGLTRGMAADGRELGIHVNGLLPGAMTRGHASVDHSLSPAAVIDMRPELVAPAASWLVHDDCPVTGRFYAASAGRMGLVFTAAAEGYQSAPNDFTIESVRDHWAVIDAPGQFVVPDTTAEYNEMRMRVFRSVVPPTGR